MLLVLLTIFARLRRYIVMGYRCCHLTASRVTDIIVLSVLEQVAPPSDAAMAKTPRAQLCMLAIVLVIGTVPYYTLECMRQT